MSKDDLIKYLEKQIIDLKHENKHLNYQLDMALKELDEYQEKEEKEGINIEEIVRQWLVENYGNGFKFEKLSNNLIGIFKRDSLELISVVNEYSIKQKIKKEKYWR